MINHTISPPMNYFALVAHIREAVRTFPSQDAAAREWRISPSYLSDVLRGNRKPGKRILNALGLEAVTHYIPKAT